MYVFHSCNVWMRIVIPQCLDTSHGLQLCNTKDLFSITLFLKNLSPLMANNMEAHLVPDSPTERRTLPLRWSVEHLPGIGDRERVKCKTLFVNRERDKRARTDQVEIERRFDVLGTSTFNSVLFLHGALHAPRSVAAGLALFCILLERMQSTWKGSGTPDARGRFHHLRRCLSPFLRRGQAPRRRATVHSQNVTGLNGGAVGHSRVFAAVTGAYS